MRLQDLPHWERLAARVWPKVDRTSSPEGCWPWSGAHRSNGYGAVTFSLDGQSFEMAAHRVVYLLVHGEIADDHDCCHACDVRNCARPDHLFEGSRRENLADMTRKGRRVTVSPRGSRSGAAKLTEAQVAEIRVAVAGGESRRSIAARFGVSKSNVNWIAWGRTWTEEF